MDEPAENSTRVLVDIAVESWKFARLFARVTAKLDAGEGARYEGQFRWFLKKLQEHLETAGLRVVNVEGQPFDPGISATALNAADFGAGDDLVIDQVIEPIIMGRDGVVRFGTVMVRKVSR